MQLKYFSSFISRDISASEFQDVGVIVPQSVLERYKKEILLLNIVSAREELVTALRETLAVVYIVVEDLAFSLIQMVACIYS